MRRLLWVLGILPSALLWLALVPARVGADAQRPRIVASYPHDPGAFTQGLLWHDGKLYESTGIRGRSSLRRVTPESGAVEQRLALPQSLFGEGLARVGDRLVQLTWRNGVALVYGLRDFAPHGAFEYEGEGWGLCFDGERLVMSDGSARLYFRDATSFELLKELLVTRDGLPLARLNELECVGRFVYANVWQSNEIVQIDPETGEVLVTVDASGLLSPEQAQAADVLNGIAFNPENGHFYLTGKLWPRVFEVRFDFDPDGLPDAVAPSGSGPEPVPTPPHPATPAPKTPPARAGGQPKDSGLCAVAAPERRFGALGGWLFLSVLCCWRGARRLKRRRDVLHAG